MIPPQNRHWLRSETRIQRNNQAGSVLIYALIVLAIGALVLTGWVQLLATRAIATTETSKAMKGRLIMENSRLLASQYILQNILTETYAGPGFHMAAGGSWAEFYLTGTSTGAPLGVTSDSDHLNVFSPGGASGYGLNISARLFDGTVNLVPWDFQTRSISPIFAHDLLTVPSVVSSDWDVDGNTVVWDPVSQGDFDFVSNTYQIPTVTPPVKNKAELPIMMSNFAYPPVTSGGALGATAYGGFLSVIQPLLDKEGPPPAFTPPVLPDPPDPADHQGVFSNGAGKVTIELKKIDRPIIYLNNDVSTLVVEGHDLTSDPTEKPGLLIIYVQNGGSQDLTKIQLQGRNDRRVYLAVKKSTSSAIGIINDPPGDHWRLVGVFENVPLTWNLMDDLDLIGGLRSDAEVSVVMGGTVRVFPEPAPGLLAEHAYRMAWLESYRP